MSSQATALHRQAGSRAGFCKASVTANCRCLQWKAKCCTSVLRRVQRLQLEQLAGGLPACLPGMVHLHIHVHTHGGLPAHLCRLQVSRWAAGHVLMIWQAQLQSSSEGSLAALPCTQCG